MKTVKNYIQGNEAGKLVGQIINVLMAVSGFIFCVYGIYIQLINNL